MGKKHDLLIDDGQLLILEVSLAVLIGDRQAIALQQIHFWIEINRKAAKETHFFDDRWWVYNTWNEWRSGNQTNDPNFPFWSIATIRRVFDDLQEMKLVITRQHEDRNKGLWVTIDYDALHGLSKSADGSAQNEQTGLRKMSRRSRQNEQTTSTTETNRDHTTETTKKTLPNGNGSAPLSSSDFVVKEMDTANVPENPTPLVSPPPSPPRKAPAHYPQYLALLKQWGHDPDKVNKVKAVKDRFMGVAKSLEVFGLSADDIPAFYEYVCKKAKAGKWKSWTVNALPNYAPEFLAQQPKSTLPLEPEYEGDSSTLWENYKERKANERL